MFKKTNFFDSLEKNKKWIFLVLILISILLRGIYVYYTFETSGTADWKDAKGYVQVGEHMAAGDWEAISNTKRGPVVPLLVAFFDLVFNDPITPFLIYNVLISSLLIIVLYQLGKELFNTKIAWLMALWGFVFPETFNYSTQVLKEPTIFFLFPLILLFLIRAVKSSNPLQHILLAVLSFSFLIHTDERFFIYFPFFILFFFFRKPFTRISFLKHTTVWVFCVLLLMLPWGIRNYNVYDQVVILSHTTTGFTSKLWGEEISQISFFADTETRENIILEKTEEHAKEFAEEHGLNPPQLWSNNEARIRSLIYFWRPVVIKPLFVTHGLRGAQHSLVRNVSDIISFGLLLPFYFFALYLFVKRKRYLNLLIASIPIIHSLLHAYLIWTIVRYRTPVLFIIAMVGFWGAIELYKLIQNRYFPKKPERLTPE